jgi:uncharacterized protein YcfL
MIQIKGEHWVMKTFFFFLIILLMFGCSSKNEKAFMKVYQKHKQESKILQNTEKIQLYDLENSTTKLLLTATYISKRQIDKKIKKDEVFIVGIYIDDNQTQNINLEDLSLSLNGSSPKIIKNIKEDNKLLKSIPFVLPWTQFYLVHFPYTANRSMNLTVNSMQYGKGSIYFSKVAKYLLRKKFIK